MPVKKRYKKAATMRLMEHNYDSGEIHVYTTSDRTYPPIAVKGGDTQTYTDEFKRLLRMIEVHGEAGYTVDFTVGLKQVNGIDREMCSCQITLPIQ